MRNGLSGKAKNSDKIVIDRVLWSLSPSYWNFVMNYNMQGMDKTIPELFAMLKAAEVEIEKEHQVLMVNKTTSFKKKGKGKKGSVALPHRRWVKEKSAAGSGLLMSTAQPSSCRRCWASKCRGL